MPAAVQTAIVDDHSYSQPDKVRTTDLARARPRARFRQEGNRRHRDLYAGLEGQVGHATGARHPRPDHREGRGAGCQRPGHAAGVQARRPGRPDPRHQADHRRADAPGQGARDLPHFAGRLRPAVAGAVDDRRQEAALHVQPVAADPRAFVGAAAGHAADPLHLQRARHRAQGRDGADERRQRSERGARRRLHLPHAAEDPLVPARDRRRRPGVQADQRPQRRVGRTGDGGQGRARVRGTPRR